MIFLFSVFVFVISGLMMCLSLNVDVVCFLFVFVDGVVVVCCVLCCVVCVFGDVVVGVCVMDVIVVECGELLKNECVDECVYCFGIC